MPRISGSITAPTTAADAQRLLSHAEAGRVPPEHAKAIRTALATARPDVFGDPALKSKLESLLRKVEESVTSVAMMQFGWTRELIEGTASVIRGRGTITGPVSPEIKALNKTGVSKAGVVGIDPNPASSPAEERAKVYAAQKQAIDSIGGFDFLSKPPAGKTVNEHTVLIKPGVNWGVNGYPTCTSEESTYATTRQALEEADKRGAKIHVVIGDESGIECKAWGGTTMGNFEMSGVLDGGVRAGLERAAMLEAKGDATYAGARKILDSLKDSSGAERKVTLKDEDALAMAEKAGVKIVGFEDGQYVRVPVPDIKPGMPGNKHFPDGVLIPKIAAEADDIINVPKPPGRHALMGCAGLSGAMKNHIGLVAGSDRVPMLHGPLDRVPGLNSGKDGGTWSAEFAEIGKKLNDPSLSRADRVALLQQLQGEAHWDLDNENGPNMMLHEKIAELTSVFADKERFTVADMRKTMSSVGPDIGDTMDVGKVIAAKDAATVDVLANAALKDAYDHLGDPKPASGQKFDLSGLFKDPGDWLRRTLGNANTPTESFYGRTWLEKNASAFDTLQIRAGMAYGIAPTSLSQIQLMTGSLDDRAFSRVTEPK